jgi:thiol-disulfide isomerase/thioredoxin
MRNSLHVCRYVVASIAVVSFGLLTAAGELRTWTDRTGQHNVEAELESFEDGKVTLRKPDGNTVTLPVERLSEADQRFVRQQTSAAPQRPASDRAAIQNVAKRFFESLRRENSDGIRGALTETARNGYDSGQSAVRKLPLPDRSGTIRVRKVETAGDDATAEVSVRLRGKYQPTKLYLRRESGDWMVHALTATGANGQVVTHNFEGGTKPITANTTTTSPNDGRFKVPDGGPDELLSFIQQLRQTPVPQNLSREALTELQKGLFTAMLEAADKIVQGKASPDRVKSAAEHQLVALRVLSQLGIPGMSGRLERLPEELDGRGLSELASTARTAALAVQMANLRGKTADDARELLAKVSAHLKNQPLGRDEVKLAMSAGQLAEQLWQDVAVQTYHDLGQLLSDSDDPAIASNGKVMQGAARRLDLLGKEMSLVGFTMDGVPFDLKDQRGKVLLVDFWATWCGPCMQEMPNIRQNYERYRDRGFNVVAVSVDRDLNSLKQYVAREAPPWIILADNHPSVQPDQSMSTYYGIVGIPTTILVGPDGKVVSLNCRGPRLGTELERLLGPAS